VKIGSDVMETESEEQDKDKEKKESICNSGGILD